MAAHPDPGRPARRHDPDVQGLQRAGKLDLLVEALGKAVARAEGHDGNPQRIED